MSLVELEGPMYVSSGLTFPTLERSMIGGGASSF